MTLCVFRELQACRGKFLLETSGVKYNFMGFVWGEKSFGTPRYSEGRTRAKKMKLRMPRRVSGVVHQL